MGDLGQDTTVTATGTDGVYMTNIEPDWVVWGPNGGYVAALILRAAQQALGRARPVSINVHFLAGAAVGEAEIRTTVTRTTRFATAATIELHQGDRLCVTAMVWGADEMGGLEHHIPEPPEVPSPLELPSTDELYADEEPPHPFWQNVDTRPIGWVEDPADLVLNGQTERWYRFVPTATFEDPWVDACRSLILLDIDSWSAACRAHTFPIDWFAPTIELSVRFLSSAAEDEWLLSRASSPVATTGIVDAQGEIWTEGGRLVATGTSTLLCLPAQRRPDGRG